MPGPIAVSQIAEAAIRVRPRAVPLADDAVQSMFPGMEALGGQSSRALDDMLDSALQPKLGLGAGGAARPTIVIVGIGRTPPLTTQSLIEQAAKRGLVPGEDIIATRYADLRVGKDRGFVRLAEGTGEGGRVLAGQGREAIFLFRGGGNLKGEHLNKIAMIQAVEGASLLADLSFIERAGSKAITYTNLKAAGLALADTSPVHGEDEAITAFDRITGRFGADTAVLKKVNSLGGKDVHFVQSHDDIRGVIAKDPDADFVMQEFLPHAKDQDIRVHMVWDSARHDYVVQNSYVRNRVAGEQTPNLANNGFPTGYVLSPWEEHQALSSARVLAEGSPTAPLHVGLDFFPRQPITASTVERNAKLQAMQEKLLAQGWSSDAVRHQLVQLSRDTAVIGEAASSAGTKGTELVLGQGINPVTEKMVAEIIKARSHGVSTLPGADVRKAAALVQGN